LFKKSPINTLEIIFVYYSENEGRERGQKVANTLSIKSKWFLQASFSQIIGNIEIVVSSLGL
jgi:hypothetical protein